MIKDTKQHLLAAFLLPALLSACGGSGGGGSNAANGPALAPPPAPAASLPTTTNFNTSEYRENYGLDQINAIAVYEQGHYGENITVAVIDTGIDQDHPQIADNLHSASTNIVTNSKNDLEDVDGHGTGVAGVIAAVRDELDVHGVAFQSKILAINAADPGSCSASDGCSFYDNDIAAALDYARTNGAKVVNISLGGDHTTWSGYQQAYRRAVEAGMIIVISAGNTDSSSPAGIGNQPQESAAFAWEQSWANGQIIIAGSVNRFNNISSFSYKAGTVAQDVYLVAGGESVKTIYKDGGFVSYSGTSFSAPHIAGAAALLFSAFPNLNAGEVAAILYDTATDLGATGKDSVYGSGLVNLAAAMQPLGTTSVAVSSSLQQVGVGDSVVLSEGAFGDMGSFAASVGDVMILDGYNRSFRIDLGDQLRVTEPTITLENFLDTAAQYRKKSFDLSPDMSLDLSWNERQRFRHIDAYFYDSGLRPDVVTDLRLSFAYDMKDGQRLSFSQGKAFAEIMDDYQYDDFLTTGKGGFSSLIVRDGSQVMAYAKPLGRLSKLNFTFGHGKKEWTDYNLEAESFMLQSRLGHTLAGVLHVSLDLGLLNEKGSVLGSLSGGALQIGEGATTAFSAARFDLDVTARLRLFGRASHGWTRVDTSPTSLLESVDNITSSSFSLGIEGTSLLRKDDRFSLAFGQPLRVNKGTAQLAHVQSRDYVTNTLNFESRALSLAPTGREIDIELSYGVSNILGMSLRLNLLHQINPGHNKNVPDANSVLLRLGSDF